MDVPTPNTIPENPTPILPKKLDKKLIIAYAFVGLVVFVVLCLAIFNQFKHQKTNQQTPITQNNQNNIVIPQTSIINKPDQPVDLKTWKTYTNTFFGYEFKYPSDWNIDDNYNWGVTFRTDEQEQYRTQNMHSTYPYDIYRNGTNLSIYMKENIQSLDLGGESVNKLFANLDDFYTAVNNKPLQTAYSTTTYNSSFMLDGIKAYAGKQEGQDGNIAQVTIFPYQGRFFEMIFGPNTTNTEKNALLNSFHFVNASNSSQAMLNSPAWVGMLTSNSTSTNLYTNSRLGLEMTIPQSWTIDEPYSTSSGISFSDIIDGIKALKENNPDGVYISHFLQQPEVFSVSYYKDFNTWKNLVNTSQPGTAENCNSIKQCEQKQIDVTVEDLPLIDGSPAFMTTGCGEACDYTYFIEHNGIYAFSSGHPFIPVDMESVVKSVKFLK